MGNVGFFDVAAIMRSCRVFVETGAGAGFSTQILSRFFCRGYCIEINPVIAAALVAREIPGVTVIVGDSGSVLEQLLPSIHEPCLFWLDAHYPALGQTMSPGVHVPGIETDDLSVIHPLIRELKAILARGQRDDVILVDDLHIYGGTYFQSGGLPPNYVPGFGLYEFLTTVDRRVEFFHQDGGYMRIT